MKKVAIVKNVPHEGGGYFEDVLTKMNIPFVTVDLEKNDPLPPVSEVRALFMMGGPDSANDETPKIRNNLRYIREIADANIPYLGICLGMQMLTKAFGGKVQKHTHKEIGFREENGSLFTVALNREGRHDPLFAGFTSSHFPVFQLHGETVLLAEGTALLGTSEGCAHQIVRVSGKPMYGIQAHLEVTKEVLESWQMLDADLRKIPLETLLADYALVKESLDIHSGLIVANLLSMA